MMDHPWTQPTPPLHIPLEVARLVCQNLDHRGRYPGARVMRTMKRLRLVSRTFKYASEEVLFKWLRVRAVSPWSIQPLKEVINSRFLTHIRGLELVVNAEHLPWAGDLKYSKTFSEDIRPYLLEFQNVKELTLVVHKSCGPGGPAQRMTPFVLGTLKPLLEGLRKLDDIEIQMGAEFVYLGDWAGNMPDVDGDLVLNRPVRSLRLVWFNRDEDSFGRLSAFVRCTTQRLDLASISGCEIIYGLEMLRVQGLLYLNLVNVRIDFDELCELLGHAAPTLKTIAFSKVKSHDDSDSAMFWEETLQALARCPELLGIGIDGIEDFGYWTRLSQLSFRKLTELHIRNSSMPPILLQWLVDSQAPKLERLVLSNVRINCDMPNRGQPQAARRYWAPILVRLLQCKTLTSIRLAALGLVAKNVNRMTDEEFFLWKHPVPPAKLRQHPRLQPRARESALLSPMHEDYHLLGELVRAIRLRRSDWLSSQTGTEMVPHAKYLATLHPWAEIQSGQAKLTDVYPWGLEQGI